MARGTTGNPSAGASGEGGNGTTPDAADGPEINAGRSEARKRCRRFARSEIADEEPDCASLRCLVRDPDPRVRLQAFWELHSCEEWRPGFELVAEDPNPMVAEVAHWLVTGSLDDQDGDLRRRAALWLLAKWDSPGARALLAERLRERRASASEDSAVSLPDFVTGELRAALVARSVEVPLDDSPWAEVPRAFAGRPRGASDSDAMHARAESELYSTSGAVPLQCKRRV